MEWSVVIPAHNEAVNLEACLANFLKSLPSDVSGILKEIIVVENGSTDGTLDACHRLQQTFPALIRVCTIARASYGEAIKVGMLECRGTHIAVLECDFLDPRFISASVAIFRAHCAQFVVGSKRHPLSVDRRPLKRRALTALYNLVFLRIFIGYPGTDTHGLKSFEAPVAKRLCELAITTDEVFQTEIVLLAWRLGIKIEEVPVQILELRNPTVTVLRRLPKVLNTAKALQRSLARFPKLSRQAESILNSPSEPQPVAALDNRDGHA